MGQVDCMEGLIYTIDDRLVGLANIDVIWLPVSHSSYVLRIDDGRHDRKDVY